MTYTAVYRSADGCRKASTFKTLKGLRRFIDQWAGLTTVDPEGTCRAVSADGIGVVTWKGATPAQVLGIDAPVATGDYAVAEAAPAYDYRDGLAGQRYHVVSRHPTIEAAEIACAALQCAADAAGEDAYYVVRTPPGYRAPARAIDYVIDYADDDIPF
jgi:hypothetical protein